MCFNAFMPSSFVHQPAADVSTNMDRRLGIDKIALLAKTMRYRS
jgi:hypothetical protein